LGEQVLVIGLGEVGMPLYEIASELQPDVYGYDVDPDLTINQIDEIPDPNILHIAFPCNSQKQFLANIIEYVERLTPNMVFVHSSIPPLTTKMLQGKLSVPIIYSPIRGKHPNLKPHLKFWTKWCASYISEAIDSAKTHLTSLGFNVLTSSSPVTLEIAKLWETAYRAILIASWQELHRICNKLDADIGNVSDFIQEVNNTLKDRPVLYPDYIGGHCLIPNTELLKSVFDSKLLEFVLESNNKRLTEVQDPIIIDDLEKVKKTWIQNIPKWYYKDAIP